MEKKVFLKGMFIVVLALSVVFMVWGQSSSKTSVVPVLDYSKIGPDDSVILAYIDPQLVKTVKNTAFNVADSLQGRSVYNVLVNDGQYYSIPMADLLMTQKKALGYVEFTQSCQMQIPNGTHTLHIAVTEMGGAALTDILPFEVAFNNVAVTYKIRLATNAEKQAGGIGIGNKVYTLEEVAQVKLR